MASTLARSFKARSGPARTTTTTSSPASCPSADSRAAPPAALQRRCHTQQAALPERQRQRAPQRLPVLGLARLVLGRVRLYQGGIAVGIVGRLVATQPDHRQGLIRGARRPLRGLAERGRSGGAGHGHGVRRHQPPGQQGAAGAQIVGLVQGLQLVVGQRRSGRSLGQHQHRPGVGQGRQGTGRGVAPADHQLGREQPIARQRCGCAAQQGDGAAAAAGRNRQHEQVRPRAGGAPFVQWHLQRRPTHRRRDHAQAPRESGLLGSLIWVGLGENEDATAGTRECGCQAESAGGSGGPLQGGRCVSDDDVIRHRT